MTGRYTFSVNTVRKLMYGRRGVPEGKIKNGEMMEGRKEKGGEAWKEVLGI